MPKQKPNEQVQQIPLSEIRPFKNHPFKVADDELMQQTIDSIMQVGVLNPAIIRPAPEGGYEMVAGHRRLHAADLAGLKTIPAIVRNLDDDEAVILELRRQDEKEAQYIATALEIYVTGSLNVFNHRSNVNIQNRVVSFDIKELGKQLKKIGMLVVQDAVWNRVTINREQRKSTRYYIDEMHLLLKEEQTAAYTVEIWKRFRKWGGVPTGITQNVKDKHFLRSCLLRRLWRKALLLYLQYLQE